MGDNDAQWERIIQDSVPDAVPQGTPLPSVVPTAPKGGAASPMKQRALAFVQSPTGTGLLCVLAAFIVSMLLLVIIRPGFVEKRPESRLDPPKVSGAKVAIGGAITAAVTLVVVCILGVVRGKGKAGSPPLIPTV